jgi:Domain of unknown function (DUF4304)
MSNSPYRLESSIRIHLAPVLRGDGFSGSGRGFRRVAGDIIHALQVQGSRYGSKFAIELGIHPLAIRDVRGRAPDPARITAYDCEFRRRLSERGSDQWWDHEASKESMDAAMLRATAVYETIGRKLFSEQSGSNSSVHTVTPDQFENGQYRFSGFASTKVRMTLALALMRQSVGNLEHARAFARIGLANIGVAGALKNELEELCATD